MENFVFPSDQDRADSPELDRVCDYLLSVLDEVSDSAAVKLAKAITEAAVKAGGIVPGVALSGPQLLMAMDDMAEALVSLQDRPALVSQADVHKVTKRYLSKRKQGYFMGELREMTAAGSDLGAVHQMAKWYLDKQQQEHFMSEIRDVRSISQNIPSSPNMGDCCCGETEQAWRLCPLHQEDTSTGGAG